MKDPPKSSPTVIPFPSLIWTTRAAADLDLLLPLRLDLPVPGYHLQIPAEAPLVPSVVHTPAAVKVCDQRAWAVVDLDLVRAAAVGVASKLRPAAGDGVSQTLLLGFPTATASGTSDMVILVVIVLTHIRIDAAAMGLMTRRGDQER